MLPPSLLQQLSRRSLSALVVAASLNQPRRAALAADVAPASYSKTESGLLYFDKSRGSGFDDVPCKGGCLERTWMLDPEAVDTAPAVALYEDGKELKIDYLVRRGWFDRDIVALSDGIANGGSVSFKVGDGTVNAAVDELVRSLPPNVVRRAVVPAAFDLDQGTRPEYPRPEPPGTTYLELTLRSAFASNSVGVCPGGDERYAPVSTCICGRGPGGGGGGGGGPARAAAAAGEVAV